MSLLALLVFSYSLTIGGTDGAFDQYTAAPKGVTWLDLGFTPYVDFQAEVALGPVFVGGGIRNDFKAVSWRAYDPVQDTYTFRAGLRFQIASGLELSAGYVHTCYHPRDCYSMIEYLSGQALAVPRFEGSTDQAFITIRGRVGGR